MISSAIVITGGAQRLGLRAALALHSLEHPVIVTYRHRHDSVDKLEAKGVRCIHSDFSQTHALEGLIHYLRAECKSIRALVHNASEWLSEQNHDDREAVFEKSMNIHAKVPYLLNLGLQQLLLKDATDAGPSDIIHLTDYVVERGSKKHIAYAASKAALNNLTLSFAAKFAPLIKVNAIAPAMLMFNQDDSESYRKQAQEKALLKVAPGADEGVRAIQYLLESKYITGRTLSLDGGRPLVS